MKLGIKLVDGNWQLKSTGIQLENYLLSKILMQFKIQLNSWLYDGTIGSFVPQLTKQKLGLTKNEIEQLIGDALNPLINNNEISNVNVICNYAGISTYKFTVSGYDITGNDFSFDYVV